MAIIAATPVVGVLPRISQATFITILANSPSPAASEAASAWDIAREQGVDPAFALAIFHQESQFGADGSAAISRLEIPAIPAPAAPASATLATPHAAPFSVQA